MKEKIESGLKSILLIFLVLALSGLTMTLVFGSGKFWTEFFVFMAVLILITTSKLRGLYKTSCILVVIGFFVLFEFNNITRVHLPESVKGFFAAKNKFDVENHAKHYDPGTKSQLVLLDRVSKAEHKRVQILRDSIKVYLDKEELGALSTEDSTKLTNWLMEMERFNNQVKSMMDIVGIKEKPSVVSPVKVKTDSLKAAVQDTAIVDANKNLSFSPFILEGGQEFEFMVMGQWNCAASGPCRPGPCSAIGQKKLKCTDNRNKYPGGDKIIHQLLVFVGNKMVNVEMKKVTENVVIVSGKAPSEGGAVSFGPNDYWVQDNLGSLRVINTNS